MHLHAFGFLMWAASVTLPSLLDWLPGAALLVYTYVALRRVYGTSHPATFARACGLGLCYLVLLCAGAFALVVSVILDA